MKRTRDRTPPPSDGSSSRSVQSKINIDSMSIRKDVSLRGGRGKEDTAVVTMRLPTSLDQSTDQRSFSTTTLGRGIQDGRVLQDAICKEEESASENTIGHNSASHESQAGIHRRGVLRDNRRLSADARAGATLQGEKAYSEPGYGLNSDHNEATDTLSYDGNLDQRRKRTRSHEFIDHRQSQNTANANNSILSSLANINHTNTRGFNATSSYYPPSRLPHQNNIIDEVEISRSRLGLANIDPRQMLQTHTAGGIGINPLQQRGNESTTMQQSQQQQLLDLMMRNASSEAQTTNPPFLAQPSASFPNISSTSFQQRRDLLLNAAAQQHHQTTELNNSNMNNMLPPGFLHGSDGHSSNLMARGLSDPRAQQLRLQQENNHLIASHGQSFPYSSSTFLNHNTMPLVHRLHQNNLFLQDQTSHTMSNPFYHPANSTTTTSSIGDNHQPHDLLGSNSSQHQYLMAPHANPPYPSAATAVATAEQIRQLNEGLTMASALARRENNFPLAGSRGLNSDYRASDNHVGAKRPKMTSEEHTKNKELEKTIRDRDFTSLGQKDDKDRLSEFLCFLRAECIEVFKATKADVYERRRSKKVNLDQVGIRCRFCVHLPLPERVGRSSSFPSSLDRIYQSVTMMIREHYPKCTMMLPEVREKYQMYRNSNTRRKKGEIVLESKSYWVNSAASLGMYDTGDGGIKMRSDKVPKTDTTDHVANTDVTTTNHVPNTDVTTDAVTADVTADDTPDDTAVDITTSIPSITAITTTAITTTVTAPTNKNTNGSNGKKNSHGSNESASDKNES